LKLYLQLPTLSSPKQGQPSILYVSAMHSVVSRALVIEKEVTKESKVMKQQFPIYFVSEVLTESKKYYSKMENFCYVVIMSARKLHHYFEAHTIKVLFSNRDNSDRISKWAMELSKNVVDFKKRSAIKSQILADFVAE
jgi:hypothetical protein